MNEQPKYIKACYYYHSRMPIIELEGKIIIFYRAIHDKDIDILEILDIPKLVKQLEVPKDSSNTDMIIFFKVMANNIEFKYNKIANLIPDVVELNKTNSIENINKLRTYDTKLAIYNPITHRIDALEYGYIHYRKDIPISRNDYIVEALLEFMSSVPKLVKQLKVPKLVKQLNVPK
jgi:hypothetical protein